MHKSTDPFAVDLDTLTDKLLDGTYAMRNLRSVKTVEQLLTRVPCLDSTVCGRCRWRNTCPFFRQRAVCVLISRLMLTEERDIPVIQARYQRMLSDYVTGSSLLTHEQSSDDLTRVLLIPVVLKRLARDVRGLKKSAKKKNFIPPPRQRHPLLATMFKDDEKDLRVHHRYFTPFN